MFDSGLVTVQQESLRSERDKLLAEKESWSKSSSAAESSDTVKGLLETEKAELTKARDEALERLKVCQRHAIAVLDCSPGIPPGCRGTREQGDRRCEKSEAVQRKLGSPLLIISVLTTRVGKVPDESLGDATDA